MFPQILMVYGLPADRIYATYFGGDDKSGLPADFEARDIWLKFLPNEQVLPFGSKDNFWEMGDTGPCGPCTEIHFDRIGNRDAASLVNHDDPTVIEIWNLVFIQFNRESDGSLKPLPAKHVDTGMGFERLTSILQNKMSNYDTDVFLPIFDAIQQATCARAYSGKIGADDADNMDMAYRVVADHIRTLSFAIADGACPGNEGREYVLRRILRRAVRYGTEVLKAKQGFFSCLVKVVVEVMGDVFPELRQHEAHIINTIAVEEASFGRTLLHGIEKFKKAAQDVQGNTLSGQDAFVLWDTYGFPLDLTQLMAEERGLVVDVNGFNIAMNEARERSRNAQNKQAGIGIVMDADATTSLRKKGVDATNDTFKYAWFQDHESEIKAIYGGNEFFQSASGDFKVGIILESTSFYAEQGGQIYDTGFLEGPSGLFQVSDVQIFGGFVVHIGSFCGKTDKFSIGDRVICKVDYDRRANIAPNHTCTHILNFALREVLGNHVDQKGSIVLPEKLRFDFSHGKPVKPEELRKIETIVNDQVKAEMDVFSKEANLADAKRVNGLRAVFGEVYPDPVRIVAIGRSVEDLLADPESENWLSISAELCGGTHISNTRDAKAFALLSEEGIAKGIRRITAVTTVNALNAIELASLIEQEVNETFKMEGSLLEQELELSLQISSFSENGKLDESRVSFKKFFLCIDPRNCKLINGRVEEKVGNFGLVIYDTGFLEGPSGLFQVSDVQIFGGFVVHIGSFCGKTDKFSIGDRVICKVDYDRRANIAPNHTCTHILNFALREVLGNHVDQKGSIVLPEKLRFDFSHGKPVKPEELRKIETIVNDQVKAEMDVFSKEANLADAKRVNGLRAVFGEVYPDPVRIVAIGRSVEDLLADPESENWLSISAELCGGTHISNTRDAKAFALLSEEGIAKGIRRITAVTTVNALNAIELASLIEQEVNETFKMEGSLLEQRVTKLNGRVEGAAIPTVKKTDLKAKISVLQNQIIKAKKKIAEENIQNAVKVALEEAEVSSSHGKTYCITHVNVGADTAAIREAVLKVTEQKGMAIMVISKDGTANKVVACAGVPEKIDQFKQLDAKEWLTAALAPLNGKGGGKGRLAQGQGSELSHVTEAMDIAASFAALKLK
ncbi:unnamed protein product [Coffea canephora]|uniref:Alanine--tRNA ligase n=1 Tax=Coffea canephora TaxID=49390 RepID=A0A068U8P1_COFCA|nr:unnamed protein product [Coffea canephora]